MSTKTLAFCGSSRRGSLNQMLLDRAILGAKEAGGQVTSVRLRDFNLPLYDGDYEAEFGVPEDALALQALIEAHQGLLIATPEHNGGYTALLKNALDWVSRAKPVANPLGGKTVALLSASPGPMGALRSQMSLQVVLHKMGAQIIPENFALGMAHEAFDDAGALKNPVVDKLVRHVGSSLQKLISRTALATDFA
jgi:chromate reductase